MAGREVGDAVLELVGVELVDGRQRGRGGAEAELGLRLDSLAEAAAVPPLLPAPEQLAAGPAEAVERADHDEVAHGFGADRAAAKAIEEVVERGEGAVAIALGDDGVPAGLAEVADVVEAD